MSLTKGFNEVESIIAKTMEYLSIPCVVGYEGFFLNYLHEDFQKLGLKTDRHSQLLAVHGSTPNTAIVCAHIDRHGLVSIGNNEYSYAALHVRRMKYKEDSKTSRKELESIAQRFEGETVFAYNPKTAEKLGEGIIETCIPRMSMGESIFFVRGMENIDLGIPLAYARTARDQDGYLKGQLDNAISLGVVYALFKAGYQGTALLSTEEEIGKSWLHIAEYLESQNLETKDLLVIDTSPYADKTPIEEGMIVLRNRDKSEIFNAGLVDQLKKRCAALEQTYKIKDEILMAEGKKIEDLGSTELGRLVQGSAGKWSGASIQIPTNMYHTSNETTTRAAIRNYCRFLISILIKDPLPLNISLAQKIKVSGQGL